MGKTIHQQKTDKKHKAKHQIKNQSNKIHQNANRQTQVSDIQKRTQLKLGEKSNCQYRSQISAEKSGAQNRSICDTEKGFMN